MKIDRVTITGADDLVNPNDLHNLSKEYPFVEWGILFSNSKHGTDRFPSSETILHFAHTPEINLSAHFCGWWSKQIIVSKDYSLITLTPKAFKRIQLNHSFAGTPNFRLFGLTDFLKKNINKSIILQSNRNNERVVETFLTENPPNNINFLYDSSGGTGKVIDEIKPIMGNYYTGYSGGIKLDNIDEICDKISSVDSEKNVWIDMESGVRTNNQFDLDKVNKILEITKKYVI